MRFCIICECGAIIIVNMGNLLAKEITCDNCDLTWFMIRPLKKK